MKLIKSINEMYYSNLSVILAQKLSGNSNIILSCCFLLRFLNVFILVYLLLLSILVSAILYNVRVFLRYPPARQGERPFPGQPRDICIRYERYVLLLLLLLLLRR